MKKLNRAFRKNTFFKILFGIFMGIILLGVAFLSVKLFLFYENNVKKTYPLVYEFNNKTEYFFQDTLEDADLSEQYLSYGVSYGVDVSEWQGKINWDKVKKSGISFAMIRLGFREIDGSNIKEDGMFRTNVEGAIKAGLRVGVYFFGTAKNRDEALEEAKFTYERIKNYEITYPVVYDIETFDRGRLKNVSYSTITDNVLTFTEELSLYGYDTMIYSNKHGFNRKLDTGKLDGKLIWLAQYVKEADYNGNYNMWQYTNEGKVDGIVGPVDLNISYFTYVSDPGEIKSDPSYKQSPTLNFDKISDTVIVKNTAELHSTPTTDLPNRIGYTAKDVKLERTGVEERFSRVIYEGRTAYIENSYIRVSPWQND